MSVAAIITADIVNSTLLSSKQEKKLMSILMRLLKPHKFEFYRGDSFQVYIKDPGIALQIVLQTRVAAKEISADISAPVHDIRASIGIGKVNLPIRTLKTAKGEAFILSGRAFDEMERISGSRLIMQSSHQNINSSLKIISYFIDYIFHQLTSKQAAVVFELLAGHTQVEVAKKLKKTQATINRHVQSSGWTEIVKILEEYKQLINQL